jgi:hypothetical protein
LSHAKNWRSVSLNEEASFEKLLPIMAQRIAQYRLSWYNKEQLRVKSSEKEKVCQMFCGSRLAASSAAPHHIVPGGLMIEDILSSKPVVRSNVALYNAARHILSSQFIARRKGSTTIILMFFLKIY